MRLNEITDAMLSEALPHGSGIDADWHFDRLKNGNIVCTNAFHGMNENGYYDGWQEFSITLFCHKKNILHALRGPSEGHYQVMHRKGDIDYRLTFRSPHLKRSWCFGLRDYLDESFHYDLSEAGILDIRNHDIVSAEEAEALK